MIFLAILLGACGPAPAQSAPISTTLPTPAPQDLPAIYTADPSTPTFLSYPQPAPSATPQPESGGTGAGSEVTNPETPASFQDVFNSSLLLGQHDYSYQQGQKAKIPFLMYLPNSYDPHKEWPLILFLHSSLEKGSDLNKLKERALPQKLEGEQDFPFIVVSPQISEGFWFQYINALEDLLDHLEGALPVDPGRVYLTGFSLGGYGTWAYARRHPERFAAIAPVAGSLDEGSPDFAVPPNICSIQSVPVWALHGANDSIVDPAEAARLIHALSNCGDDARITLYPDTGHLASGDLAYADPGLYDWFLSHKK